MERQEATTPCPTCGTATPENELVAVVTHYRFGNPETEIMCEGCTDDRAMQCTTCREWHDSDLIHQTGGYDNLCVPCATRDGYQLCNACEFFSRWGEDVHGDFWCDECYQNNCDECEQCGSTIPMTETACEECANRLIQNYSFKPAPFFTTYEHGAHTPCATPGKTLFMGLELEAERSRKATEYTYQIAEDVWTTHPELQPHMYFKHDGSISDGWETVTHPRTLESWAQWAEFQTFIHTMTSKGMRAWAWDDRGIHIHASKATFNGLSHMVRLVFMFRKFETAVTTIARRQTTYASFERIRRGKLIHYPMMSGHCDALNFSNPDTVEFRIFKSSLNHTRIMANLQFVVACIEWTRTHTAQQIAHAEWTDFLEWCDSHDLPLVRPCYMQESFEQSEAN